MRTLMWATIGLTFACAGGAYGWWDQSWTLALICGALCLHTFLLRDKWKYFRQIAAVLLGLALGICWYQIYHRLHITPAVEQDGQVMTVTAIATDYSYDTAYGQAVEGRSYLGKREYRLLLYLDEEADLRPGDQIQGRFRLRTTLEGADGDYHRSQGIAFLAYPQGTVLCRKDAGTFWREYPAVIRRSLTDLIDRFFPQDTAFFAKALLLGDRSDVDYEANTDFKISGISHVIAVSGFHVSILFSLVYLATGKRRFLTGLIGIPVVVLFAAVAGFTPSITRACIMQILMMAALMLDREYDPSTALSFAVLVMLLADPLTVTSVSFQLSVACMAGIFLFSGRIKAWVDGFAIWGDTKGKKWKRRLRAGFSGGISMTLSSMFFTTPLVAWYFGTVSLVGILTNLLTLWVISLVFYGIMVVCLLALVWPWGAAALAWLVSWPVRYVLAVSGALASFPLAAVYTCSIYVAAWLVVCYVLIGVFLVFRERQPHVLICCVILSLGVSLLLSWLEPARDDLRMTVLDVGQGQCVLLQAQDKTYVIDCGGDSDTQAADQAAQTLLSMGIARLDGLIVTHYDRDHAGGVAYLLSRVPADRVFLPPASAEEELQRQILAACGDRGVLVTQDHTLTWGGNCLSIFAPVLSSTSNESGLSVLFEGEDHDILITGDMSALGEELLLRQKQIPDLEALVVGHHGSATSTGEALLAATRPEYAFISVGGDNPYGHPKQEVLDRLERYGCQICRTDISGTIIFRR